MKKVVVFGICGKMGRIISRELLKENDISIIGGFDKENVGKDIGEVLGIKNTGYKIYNAYEKIKKLRPDIIVDFTSAEIVINTINWAIDNGISIVVGTTGIKKDELIEIEKKALQSNSKVLIAPNFSIGAVIMMKISKMISRYFDNCEIIELHHDQKKDAPSGTSISTAEQIAKEKEFNKERLKTGENETISGSRGAFSSGVHIHSIRLPGLLAHQEVIFGTKGQTLSIRHDSLDRTSFYPGVILAIRNIDKLPNYTFGLDKLISI